MTKDEALMILADNDYKWVGNVLECMSGGTYMHYNSTFMGDLVSLDGEFSADELEAIVVIMRDLIKAKEKKNETV